MKIIINESQFKLIVESNKEKNLLNLTNVYEDGLNPDKWDSYFLFMKNKKKRNYAGYYIDGNVDLSKSDITELKYLVKVGGYLYLRDTPITELPMLSEVGDDLYLRFTPIKELPMLSYVGGNLYLNYTPITELPMLSTVGSDLNLNYTQITELPLLTTVGEWLYLSDTPLGKKLKKTMSEKEIRNKFGVKVGLEI
jgi:hypothetical protein